MVNFIEFIIPSEHNDRRIDRFLRFFFKDLSQNDIEKLLRSKMIRLNGKKVTSDIRILEQSLLRYPDFLIANDSFSSKNQSKHIHFPSEIILYEDTDLMVINKPHGLASQGGSNIKIHLDMMLESLPKKNNYRPSTIHRLDKDTSGCLVVAKKPSIAARLGEALKNREFQKYYLAITDNIPSNSCDTIENYLLKSLINKQDIIQIVDANTHKAQFSKSVYYVISKNDTHKKIFDFIITNYRTYPPIKDTLSVNKMQYHWRQKVQC